MSKEPTFKKWSYRDKYHFVKTGERRKPYPRELVPLVLLWLVIVVVALGTSLVLALRNFDLSVWNAWISNLIQAVYVSLTFALVWLTYSLFKIATNASDVAQQEHRQRITPVFTVTEFKASHELKKYGPIGDHLDRAFSLIVEFENMSSVQAINITAILDFRKDPYLTGIDDVIETTKGYRYNPHDEFGISPKSMGHARFGFPIAVPGDKIRCELSEPILRHLGHTLTSFRNFDDRDWERKSIKEDEVLSLVVSLKYSDVFGNEVVAVYESVGANPQYKYKYEPPLRPLEIRKLPLSDKITDVGDLSSRREYKFFLPADLEYEPWEKMS